MISAEAAWERLVPWLEPLAPEVAQRTAAVGRVLAERLLATREVPAHDVSAMDGYAVSGELEPGATLPVTGTVAAGDPPGERLPPGDAMRIMTGAPVPAGADRVIPIEDTDGGVESVVIEACGPAGAHIRCRGEVLEQGAELLPAGAPLTPGALALLASQGIPEMAVHRRPTVAVLTSGDEVVPPSATPDPGELRDSHTDFLVAASRKLGIEARPLGIVADHAEELRGRLEEAMKADVALVTGGVSAGAYDLVRDTLTALGCEILFHGVAIQPGKPLLAVRHEGGLLFGLPGNPGSVQCCYRVFVRPALRRMMGHADGYCHDLQTGLLAAEVRGRPDRERFLTATLERDDDPIQVEPIPAVGSHDLRAWARAEVLIRVPAGTDCLPAGAECEYLPLGWPL